MTIRFQQLPAWLLGMNTGFKLNYTSGLLFSHPRGLGVGGWGSQAYLAAFLAMKINSIMSVKDTHDSPAHLTPQTVPWLQVR